MARRKEPGANDSGTAASASVAALIGQAEPVAVGNEGVVLANPDDAWWIAGGKVDVFAVPLREGAPVGARQHLFRAESGQLLLGMDFAAIDRDLGLIAIPAPGARLRRLQRRHLIDVAAQPEGPPVLAQLLDDWVYSLMHAVDSEAARTVEATAVVADEGVRRAPRRSIHWVQPQPEADSDRSVDHFIPVALRGTASNDGLVMASTEALVTNGAIWPSLTAFHRLTIDRVALNRRQEVDVERARLKRKANSDRRALEQSVQRLGSMLEEPAAGSVQAGEEEVDSLVAACRLVAGELGIKVRPHPFAERTTTARDAVHAVARASGIRVRQVVLPDGWWATDSGPLVAFREHGDEANDPVALLQSGGGYLLVNPVNGDRTPVDGGVAASLAPFAYTLYRPFPTRALGVIDILRLGLRGTSRDLAVVTLMGLAAGLLGTIFPIATGIIFDQLIPGAERSRLVHLSLALVVCVLATTVFQVIRGVAMIRLEARMGATLQAAVWDRLLGLPVPFFREYSAGDLTMRGMGIDAIRQILSSSTIATILSSVFSVFNLVLLFVYAPSLAPVAVGLVAIAVGVTVAIALTQVGHQRTLANLEGRLSGLVLQFINGIQKFRVAGAELRVFANWAREFGGLRAVAFRVRNIRNVLAVFNSAFPPLASLVLFAFAGLGDATLSTGSFLAFFAAFSILLAATLQLAMTLVYSLQVVPILERARPILETSPEVDELRAIPGRLQGQVEVSHLGFRYGEDGPLVLKDVSFSVQPGEFLAVVGASGCGKSTLLRLLLGFERPTSGAIYYDGQDLQTVDVSEVRRQIGTVPQNGQLLAGDIFRNITGSHPATLEEAMEAARLAGVARDIEQMPMGLHTVVGEGGTGLSGGQRQRLLIARAVVSKPRILFLDEATSALDNRSQAIVSERLQALQATRVVIAHRLSTIRNADRILVFDDGRIVQTGSYEELMAGDGPFRQLAERQLA